MTTARKTESQSPIAAPELPDGLARREVDPLERPVRLSPLPEQPLVSVLMANRNYERYLAEAIESVLAQSYPAFELLICDDGSTDGSVRTIERYSDRDARVRLLQRPVAGGQGSAFNELFERASGDIICFQDSDDRVPSHRLERIVDRFRECPSAGLISHPMRAIDESSAVIGSVPFRTRWEPGWIADRLIRRGGRITHMPFGGMAIRRDVADLAFPVPEPVHQHYADNYVNIVAAALSEVTLIEEPLYDYRIHGSNAMQRAYRDREVTIDELEGMRRQAAAANERLAQLGYPPDVINLDRNLNYRQQEFLLGLFDGYDRRSLTSLYTILARSLARDDLYFVRERIARILIYGIAIPMPMSVRAQWLLVSRSPGRAARKLLARLLHGRGGPARTYRNRADGSQSTE